MNEIDIRRSIRKYRQEPVQAELIEKLLRAGMQAPSAGNQQPWEFVVVTRKDRLQTLSQMSPYASMTASAAAAIIPVADSGRFRHPDFWQQDMAACTQNILLEAAALGLGTVWLGVAPLEDRMNYLRKEFEIEPGKFPFGVISIGRPEDEGGNRFIDRFDPSRIRND